MQSHANSKKGETENMKKGIIVLLMVFSFVLAGCVQNAAPPAPTPSLTPTAIIQTPTPSPTASLEKLGINVSVSIPSENYFNSKTVEADEGESALAVSSKAFELLYKNYSFGAYVYSVEGFADDSGKGEYWQYYFNGNLAPVGASDFRISEEGVLEWRLESPDLGAYDASENAF